MCQFEGEKTMPETNDAFSKALKSEEDIKQMERNAGLRTMSETGTRPQFNLGPFKMDFRGQPKFVCNVWDNDYLRRDDHLGVATISPVRAFQGNLPLLDPKTGADTGAT